MAIGCGLALAALVLFPAIGVSWGTTLFLIVLFFCPLMHLFGMHGDHGGHAREETDNRTPTSKTDRHH
jgi:hypothetical protein